MSCGYGGPTVTSETPYTNRTVERTSVIKSWLLLPGYIESKAGAYEKSIYVSVACANIAKTLDNFSRVLIPSRHFTLLLKLGWTSLAALNSQLMLLPCPEFEAVTVGILFKQIVRHIWTQRNEFCDSLASERVLGRFVKAGLSKDTWKSSAHHQPSLSDSTACAILLVTSVSYVVSLDVSKTLK
ncbi:hypothetical protein STEG23_008884, partial [Scotinomys teguina]